MGFAPRGATKATHGSIRDVFKIWLLSVQYGATARSLVEALPFPLAQRVPNPLASAEDFLEKHRRVYRRIGSGLKIVSNFSYLKPTVKKLCMGGVIG